MKFFLAFFIVSSLSYAETQVYRATAKHEGKLAYYEKHTVISDKGRTTKSTTEYSDDSGKIIGLLESDYSQSLSAPTHTMKDFRAKNQHGLRHIGEELELFNQDEGKKEETKRLSPSEFKGKLVVAAQGLHYYLLQHFDEVLKQGKLDLAFLIPGRLDAYNFYLKVVRKTEDDAELEILIDNWFLRLFAPKLRLFYDLKKRRLLRYQGLSNMKNTNGDMMNVEIEYHYPN